MGLYIGYRSHREEICLQWSKRDKPHFLEDGIRILNSLTSSMMTVGNIQSGGTHIHSLLLESWAWGEQHLVTWTAGMGSENRRG